MKKLTYILILLLGACGDSTETIIIEFPPIIVEPPVVEDTTIIPHDTVVPYVDTVVTPIDTTNVPDEIIIIPDIPDDTIPVDSVDLSDVICALHVWYINDVTGDTIIVGTTYSDDPRCD